MGLSSTVADTRQMGCCEWLATYMSSLDSLMSDIDKSWWKRSRPIKSKMHSPQSKWPMSFPTQTTCFSRNLWTNQSRIVNLQLLQSMTDEEIFLRTLAVSIWRLIGSIAAMIHIVTQKISGNAKLIGLTTEILARMVYKYQERNCDVSAKRSHSKDFAMIWLNYLLRFLIAVNTNLKPFESVPQPSALYLSVKKLLWVIMLPTLCMVFRQDISIWE